MFDAVANELHALDPAGPSYAVEFVQLLFVALRRHAASDAHVQPAPGGLELRFRIDGVLLPVGTFSPGTQADVVTRLKVLAGLLTYRSDLPQEGRIHACDPTGEFDVRVSTFPTLHGERVALRMLGGEARFERLADLGLPEDVREHVDRLLGETSGAILVVGPAGSGKTTTLYACLREIVASSVPRSIVTLEDPIEMALAGVTQSQVQDERGFDLESALRGVLRQDPEVILIGELRDRATAALAIQAALSGQLILSSYHADSAPAAVRRLLEMGIEPFALRSGLRAIVHQRLVRKLCSCAQPAGTPDEFLGLEARQAKVPRGCHECAGTGYRGRVVLCELLALDDPALAEAVLSNAELAVIERAARSAGMIDRWTRAASAVEAGLTSPAEVRRVLGNAPRS